MEQFKAEIREQSEALRKLKAINPEWHTDKKIFEHIWNLLNLKSKDPSLNEEVFFFYRASFSGKVRKFSKPWQMAFEKQAVPT